MLCQPAIFIWLVFTQFFIKFYKGGSFQKLQSGLSNCEIIISADQMLNALEDVKVP